MLNRAPNNTQLPERATSEAVKTVPSKQNCCQIGPTVTFDSRVGRFGGFQDDKKNCRNGPPEYPPAGAGPTEAVKTGLSRTKLLPNGTLSDIELPRRVLTTGAGPLRLIIKTGRFQK